MAIRLAGQDYIPQHADLEGLAADDHTQYQKESEKGVANGYAGLGADSKVPDAQSQVPSTHPGADTGVHGVGAKYVAAIATQGAEALPLTGGTLSGGLTITTVAPGMVFNTPAPEWSMGLFYQISGVPRAEFNYNDNAGAFSFYDKVTEGIRVQIQRSTGKITSYASGDAIMPSADNQGNIGNNGQRWALVRAVTITSGDLGFEEQICPKCDEAFVVGDALVLLVKALHDLGTLTVPIHLRCVDKPARDITVRVPRMKTEYRFIDGEIKPIKVAEREKVKVARRQVKHKPGAEGFEPLPLYTLDEETGTFRDEAGNPVAIEEATETVEREVEQIIYQESVITI